MHKHSKHLSVPLYTPAVLLLALIVGISYLGVGFVLPLRALYGRQIGANSVEIGLMASSFLLAGFLATPVIGWLADHFSYRKMISIGLMFHAVLILLYIPVQDPVLLIGLRALEGIATACILPPARALMNTLAPRARQGEALGVVSAAQTVGISIGPAVGALMASVAGYTFSFALASIPLGLAAITTLLLIPSGQGKQPPILEPFSIEKRHELFSRPLILIYVLQIILLVTNGVASSIWSLYMLDRGASITLIGLSFTTFALPIVLVAPFAGRFSDHFGRYGMLLVGLCLTGVVCFIYSLPLSPAWIVIISILEGTALALARGSVDGLLADVMPMAMKGKIQAIYSTAGTLGSFFGSLAAGILYLLAPGAPFFVEGILYLGTLLFLLFPSVRRWFSVQRALRMNEPISE
jgi:DHA1 family solute carrier family 18 vesicular amine transporter 1/2